jgi:light-regulated signal transduction histidine kinase (bacteriophytochrome)
VSKTGPASDGAIQPIGFLVALAPDWRISRVSANIEEHLGKSPADLLGQSITSLFAEEAVHSLRNRLALLRGPDPVERLFSVPLTGGTSVFDVALHMSGSTAVLEAEPSHDLRHERDSTGTIRGMIGQLGQIEGLAAMCAEAARQLRALSGFDRVVIRRVGDDDGGPPLAEAVRSGARSMTGEPGEPIDGRTIQTIIADTGADPVAIVAPPHARRALDLSNALLLAPPRAELAAMRDAGIGAAILLPVIVAGRRWGGIGCYHRAPCCPSFERRSAIEWFAMMLAMQIEIRELRARLSL